MNIFYNSILLFLEYNYIKNFKIKTVEEQVAISEEDQMEGIRLQSAKFLFRYNNNQLSNNRDVNIKFNIKLIGDDTGKGKGKNKPTKGGLNTWEKSKYYIIFL